MIKAILFPVMKSSLRLLSIFLVLLLPLLHLMQLMDVLKPSRRVEIAKDMLETFAKQNDTTSDPILIHALLDVSR